jgi:hypothetical protein
MRLPDCVAYVVIVVWSLGFGPWVLVPGFWSLGFGRINGTALQKL